MSGQFGFIDIILLAMFAGFIILRLRNILGRKTGHQGKPIGRYFPKGMETLHEIEKNEAIKSGNVPPNNPNSSPMIEKMKSVCGVGRRWFFSTLLPRPTPNKPPLPKLSNA